jgi:hypothetical protein
VKSEFRLAIDDDLEWISHELLADRLRGLRERGAEHHDLLLHWSCLEDVLNITSHICCGMLVEGKHNHGGYIPG